MDTRMELERQLQKVARRLGILHMLRCLLVGSAAGLALVGLMAALAFVLPLPAYRLWAWGWLFAGWIGGILYGSYRWSSPRDAARVMDRHGLEERMATAYDYRESADPVAVLQREEAVQYGRQYVAELAKHLPAKPELLAIAALAAGAVLSLALMVMPNPAEERWRERRTERQWVEEQQQTAKNALEQVARWEEARNPEEIDGELRQVKDELAALADSLDGKDARAALAELERRLAAMQKIQSELEKRILREEAVARALSGEQNPALRRLAEALASANRAGLEAAARQLAERSQELEDNEREALAERLEQLAQAAANHGDDLLAGEWNSLADQLQQGASLSPEDAGRLAQALSAGMDRAAAARELLAQTGDVASQLASSGLELAERLAERGDAVTAFWKDGGQAYAMANPQGSGSGPGPNGQTSAGMDGQTGAGGKADAGHNGQTGTGGSAGQTGTGGSGGLAGGNGGSASGSGQQSAGQARQGGANGPSGPSGGGGASSGGGSSGQGGGSSGQSGLAGGTGSGSRSLVSVPASSIPDESAPVLDSGPLGEGQGDIEFGTIAPGGNGIMLPYEEVYARYESEWMESLGQHPLPESMRQLVRDYFTNIHP